jgi:hypothetical protein
VIWYGYNLFMVAVRLGRSLFSLLSGKATPPRLFLEMHQVYATLTGPLLHVRTVRTAFERAAEKGVIWDPPIFYILDRLAKEEPEVWDNRL